MWDLRVLLCIASVDEIVSVSCQIRPCCVLWATEKWKRQTGICMQVVRAVVSGLRHPVSSSHSVAATYPLSSPRTYAQYAHSISTWLIPSWSANVNPFFPWHHCRVDNLPCSSLSSSLSWTWGFQILPGLSWSTIIVFTKYTHNEIWYIIWYITLYDYVPYYSC